MTNTSQGISKINTTPQTGDIILKEVYIYHLKWQQIIDELRSK